MHVDFKSFAASHLGALEAALKHLVPNEAKRKELGLKVLSALQDQVSAKLEKAKQDAEGAQPVETSSNAPKA